jgi:hypothetical protein
MRLISYMRREIADGGDEPRLAAGEFVSRCMDKSALRRRIA